MHRARAGHVRPGPAGRGRRGGPARRAGASPDGRRRGPTRRALRALVLPAAALLTVGPGVARAQTPTPGTGGRQPAPWKALHDGATAVLTTVGNLLRTGDAAGTGCATFSWCGLQRAFGGKTR